MLRWPDPSPTKRTCSGPFSRGRWEETGTLWSANTDTLGVSVRRLAGRMLHARAVWLDLICLTSPSASAGGTTPIVGRSSKPDSANAAALRCAPAMMGPVLSFIKMLGRGRIGVQDCGRLSTHEIPVKRKVPNLEYISSSPPIRSYSAGYWSTRLRLFRYFHIDISTSTSETVKTQKRNI